jgi:hypothetical protein
MGRDQKEGYHSEAKVSFERLPLAEAELGWT